MYIYSSTHSSKILNEKISYKIEVRGRVQGVGFRHACRQEARFLGITGFVMNKPNGTVYIEAEGSPEQLNQFISWCNKGPGYGFTDNVQVESQPYKALNGFIIKY